MLGLGGLLSVLTLALALPGTDAFFFGGKGDKYHLIAGHLTKGSSHSTKTTVHSSGFTHHSAGITCSSTSYSASYADWKNSYIKAVANVVKDVCSSNYDGNIMKVADKMVGFAKAWARATAEASAQCVSYTKGGGKAKGCAYASASSKAFEKAFASAHAHASAEAFAKHCNCVDAEAWSFGDSHLFLKLAAEAYAAAEATVCATGNELSVAHVSVDCQAHIFAQTYAFAAAKASIAGRCYGKNSKAKAYTAIQAKVDAKVYDKSKCIVKEKKKGRSKIKTFSDAKTSSKKIHKSKTGKGKGRRHKKGSKTKKSKKGRKTKKSKKGRK